MITLPAGIAVFPALNKPDTKFNDEGVYKADVFLTSEQAQPVIDQIQKVANGWMGYDLSIADGTKKKKGKFVPNVDNPCFQPEFDKETGELTGRGFVFKCQVKNRMTKEGKLWDRRPMVMDAKKNVMSPAIPIWGGSKIRVQVEVYEWLFNSEKGINLQPVIVQVIDLKTAGAAGDAGAFNDEEGGYETSEPDTSEFNDSDDNSSEAPNDSADY